MNERPLMGRIVSFLLAFYALGLAAFFGYAFFTFSANGYLPFMRWQYSLLRAFVLFMDYVIPIHAAAVAVAASLAGIGRAPRAPGGPAEPFNRIVSSTLVTFLLLTAAYAVLFEAVSPMARRRLADMQYQSSLARQYLREAGAAEEKGDYRAGLDAVVHYLAIDSGNKQVEERALVLQGKAAKQAAPAPGPAVAGLDGRTAGENAQALMEKAQFYAREQDWFSAHFYAQSAASLDPRRADAMRLAAEAWDRISGLAETQGNAKAAELFQQKKDAYSLLVGGDALAAYYRFVDLGAKNPTDQDIARYLKEAADAVARITFFIDDVKKVEPLPGTQKILFLNSGESGATEAVYIGKMIEVAAGETYFYDIEAIRYNSAGVVSWHFSAPYGKREGSTILMHCIDSADPKVQYLPLYLQGTRPAPDRNVLLLRPTVEELRALSTGRDSLSTLGLAELWRLRSRLGAFGLSRQALTVDMTMKALMPFAFLILSIFALALGWAFRARTAGRRSAFTYLLAPLAPVMLAVLSLLYVHAHRIVIGFIVIAFGLAAALVALAVLQLVLLAVALVLLAGQSTR